MISVAMALPYSALTGRAVIALCDGGVIFDNHQIHKGNIAADKIYLPLATPGGDGNMVYTG
jgi:hypothetical protein